MTPRVVRTVEDVKADVRANVEWSLRTVAAQSPYRAAGKYGDDVPPEWINGYIDRLTQAVLAPRSVTAEQVEAGKDAAEDALSTDCHIRETRHVGEYECDCPSTVTIDRIIRAALAAMGIPVEGGAE